MLWKIKQDNIFIPFEINFRIENVEELMILHNILIKTDGKLSEIFHDLAAELEKYEK